MSQWRACILIQRGCWLQDDCRLRIDVPSLTVSTIEAALVHVCEPLAER
jgi:hypothetical protein